MGNASEIPENSTAIFGDLKQLIEQSRRNVAVAVNAEMTLLYWTIGKRYHLSYLMMPELPTESR